MYSVGFRKTFRGNLNVRTCSAADDVAEIRVCRMSRTRMGMTGMCGNDCLPVQRPCRMVCPFSFLFLEMCC